MEIYLRDTLLLNYNTASVEDIKALISEHPDLAPILRTHFYFLQKRSAQKKKPPIDVIPRLHLKT